VSALKTSILNAASTTGMIFVILMGSEIFNAFLALSQMPMQAADTISSLGLPPYGVLAAILALYILLGAVMDELAMILLTLPVFFPIVSALDFGMAPDDLAIWFGILLLIVVGIGLTAPPIGLNVFVINAIARHIPMGNIPIARTYRGVLPFIAADIVRLSLVLIFPSLALWLVHLLT
jgi:TRAP-type C4-dicarboxylate transport system permease large subunit